MRLFDLRTPTGGTDATLPTPADDQFLIGDTGAYVVIDPANVLTKIGAAASDHNHDFADLDDVDIADITEGMVLVWGSDDKVSYKAQSSVAPPLIRGAVDLSAGSQNLNPETHNLLNATFHTDPIVITMTENPDGIPIFVDYYAEEGDTMTLRWVEGETDRDVVVVASGIYIYSATLSTWLKVA